MYVRLRAPPGRPSSRHTGGERQFGVPQWHCSSAGDRPHHEAQLLAVVDVVAQHQRPVVVGRKTHQRTQHKAVRAVLCGGWGLKAGAAQRAQHRVEAPEMYCYLFVNSLPVHAYGQQRYERAS